MGASANFGHMSTGGNLNVRVSGRDRGRSRSDSEGIGLGSTKSPNVILDISNNDDYDNRK